MAFDRPGLRRLILLTAIAGGPAIAGAWLGGFSYTPFLAAVFFAIGAGAILQVVVEVGKLLERTEADQLNLFTWPNLSGLFAGLAIMWVTALIV